jgi:hypothetical protein
MENIKPFSLWLNGQTLQAEKIDIFSNYDNLKTNASFGYSLYDKDEIKISEGVVIMKGENYTNWDGSNKLAFEFVAKELNIELI